VAGCEWGNISWGVRMGVESVQQSREGSRAAREVINSKEETHRASVGMRGTVEEGWSEDEGCSRYYSYGTASTAAWLHQGLPTKDTGIPNTIGSSSVSGWVLPPPFCMPLPPAYLGLLLAAEAKAELGGGPREKGGGLAPVPGLGPEPKGPPASRMAACRCCSIAAMAV